MHQYLLLHLVKPSTGAAKLLVVDRDLKVLGRVAKVGRAGGVVVFVERDGDGMRRVDLDVDLLGDLTRGSLK